MSVNLSHITSVLVGTETEFPWNASSVRYWRVWMATGTQWRLTGIFCDAPLRYFVLIRLSDRGNPSDWWWRQSPKHQSFIVYCFAADHWDKCSGWCRVSETPGLYCVLCMMEAVRVSGQFAVVLCFVYADRPRKINMYSSLKKLGYYVIVLAPDLQK